MSSLSPTTLNLGVASYGHRQTDVTVARRNGPHAAVALTTYFDTENLYYGSSFTDVTANTLPKQLVRPVWMVKLCSGSSLGTVRVGGSVDNVPPT